MELLYLYWIIVFFWINEDTCAARDPGFAARDHKDTQYLRCPASCSQVNIRSVRLSTILQGHDTFDIIVQMLLSTCQFVRLYGLVRAMLCTTSTVQDYVLHHQPEFYTLVHKGDLCPREVVVAPGVYHFLVVYMEHAQNGHFLSEHTQVVHKVVHNKHANQGSQCSSVPKYTVMKFCND